MLAASDSFTLYTSYTLIILITSKTWHKISDYIKAESEYLPDSASDVNLFDMFQTPCAPVGSGLQSNNI